ncbi:MAG: HD domain-containing protein [Desulfobacteraceae bacterium]|nr:MAG: HD domain-containing protein [Desulfobacteraceae bacterium]
MKKIFCNCIKMGETIEDVFVLSEKVMMLKRDGKGYLNVKLADRTGSIQGVIWDNADKVSALVGLGDVVAIRGAAGEYRGALQLVIKNIEKCDSATIDPADFLPKTSHNIDGMFDRLVKITNEVKTDCLKTLLAALWRDESLVARFKAAPAAKRMHHAFIGGLLEHTLSMAILVERIAGHYSGVDMDLLLTGVVFHDMGKIQEFDYRFNIDYSDEGRLLSHIVIGLRLLDEKLAEIDGFPEETAHLIRHMIVSHHGAQNFGSPEPPKTLEAVLLNYIDEIDSKVNGIRDFMAAEDSSATWTSYHRIWGRHFYKGKQA